MDKYEKLEKVGEGTFGKVYKAREKATGKVVALKKIRSGIDEEGVPASVIREISHLQKLSQSIYIVRLLEVGHVINVPKSAPPSASSNRRLYLVFEYLDTDLKKFIDSRCMGANPNPLPPSLIQSFLFQLCKGVAHCHSHGVLHRDLKPHNILLESHKGILKISGFGHGRDFSVPPKCYINLVVTLWYRAPEILLGSPLYSTGVDMWSVGCIFAEMVCGQTLFPGDSEFQQLLKIFRIMGTPTEEQWPDVSSLPHWHIYPKWQPQNLAGFTPNLGPQGVDLLTRMLKYNPAKRISAKEALQHPYFDNLDKSQF